jgi:3-isopropylmalate/(R)-2-methylmalate dehydratase small subunit
VVKFPIDRFSKTCLTQGVDELGYLLARQDAIKAYETAHPS